MKRRVRIAYKCKELQIMETWLSSDKEWLYPQYLLWDINNNSVDVTTIGGIMELVGGAATKLGITWKEMTERIKEFNFGKK